MMCKEQKYLSGWKGLSDYLGGVPRATLVKWEQEGKIKKYSIGDSRRVFFKSEEVDEELKKQE